MTMYKLDIILHLKFNQFIYIIIFIPNTSMKYKYTLIHNIFNLEFNNFLLSYILKLTYDSADTWLIKNNINLKKNNLSYLILLE